MTILEQRRIHREKLLLAERMDGTGRHDLAVSLWRSYLKDVPDDFEALFNVGVMLQNNAQTAENRNEAARCFAAIVNSEEASSDLKADALSNLGMLATEAGENEQAASAYEMALCLVPNHYAASINLSSCRMALGDYSGALRFAAQAAIFK